MAAITTGLPSCSFLENLPDVCFSGVDAPINVTVLYGGVNLLDKVKMTPNHKNQILIYVKQIIRNITSFAQPKQTEVTLPILSVQAWSTSGYVIGQTAGAVIPGHITLTHTTPSDWFIRNFLTWQSQIIETTRLQPQWLAVVAENTSKVTLKSRLYTADGRTFERSVDTELAFTQPHAYCQIDTSFATLWGELCRNTQALPLSYDVYGAGYNQEGTTSTKQYPQRYILRAEHYNDVCFGFENTLGGFDTLMLAGKQIYLPEGNSTTFKTYNGEKELSNSYTSIWEANTGYLGTERQATQFQDFLKSANRHIIYNGLWRQIIIVEYKIKHKRGESNAFSFKYHLSNKDESRYYERTDLPDVDLPINFYDNGAI